MPISSRSPGIGPLAGIRPWMVVTPVALALTAGLALFALERVPLPTVSPIDPDNAVAISLVQPIEPEVIAGERMEVGELVDGYAHKPIPAAASDVDAYEPEYATAWLEPSRSPEPVTRWSSQGATVSPTATQPTSSEASNPYGFDAPTPDYAADREARRERLDRMQVEAATATDARPVLNAETAFY